jgi:hypothetical protein
MSTKNVEIVAESGTERFIPLNKLKKSPNNARKTPHSEASIEAYAATPRKTAAGTASYSTIRIRLWLPNRP